MFYVRLSGAGRLIKPRKLCKKFERQPGINLVLVAMSSFFVLCWCVSSEAAVAAIANTLDKVNTAHTSIQPKLSTEG